MEEIKVKDILVITKGELIIGNLEETCQRYAKDSREVQTGDIYIGIKGEKINGGQYYEKAFENGAKACIIQEIEIGEAEKQKYKNKTIIKVEDTIKALQQIASYKRNQYNIPVVAITGSVGKTSTKDIVANVVNQKYKTLKTIGNYNNHIGMPLTILNLKQHEALVIEMGMNHLKEISVLTQIARPTIAVITNVGTAHIGNLGSRENILKAKLEILEGLQKGGKVVINNDNDLLHRWYNENSEKYNIITYGIENVSDYMAENIEVNENGSKYTLKITNEDEIKNTLKIMNEDEIKNTLKITNKDESKNTLKIANRDESKNTLNINNKEKSKSILNIANKNTSQYITKTNQKIQIEVPVGGNHFVLNSLCAIAVGKQLNIEDKQIKQGIKEFELSKKRMDISEKNGVTIINDSYNANYDSMKAAIEYLSKRPEKRKIAVLGDMLELGEYSEQLHQKVGKEIVKNNIDLLITVGVEAKNISQIAKEAKIETIQCNTNEEAVQKLKNKINKGDCILIKASNSMHFDEIVNKIQGGEGPI